MAGLRPADSIKTKVWSHFRFSTKDTFAFNLFPEGFANLAKTARSALVLFDPFCGKGREQGGTTGPGPGGRRGRHRDGRGRRSGVGWQSAGARRRNWRLLTYNSRHMRRRWNRWCECRHWAGRRRRHFRPAASRRAELCWMCSPHPFD